MSDDRTNTSLTSDDTPSVRQAREVRQAQEVQQAQEAVPRVQEVRRSAQWAC